MTQPLRVLILEDRPSDALLTVHQLKQAGFDPIWERVETEEDFLARLSAPWDLILSDYAMPQFDAMQALRLARAKQVDAPLIIVSGTIGEEVAVDAIKEGAVDYILKDRMGRLGSAVTQALAQRSLREAQRQAENALAESEKFFRATLDSLSAQIAVVDAHGNIVATNQAWKSLASENCFPCPDTNRWGNYLAACDDAAANGDAHAAATALAIRNVIAGRQETWLYEYARHRADEQKWFYCRLTRFLANGIVNVVVAHEDITDLKLAKEQLAGTLARYESLTRRYSDLFEFSPEALILTNPEGIVVQANRRVETVFGWNRDELVGQPIEVLMPQDNRNNQDGLLRRFLGFAVRSDASVAYPGLCGLRKDGQIIPIDLSLSPMETENGTMIAIAVRDVTEQHRVMEELARSGEQLRAANARIEQERAALAERVAERTAELTAANAELEKVSQAKSEFLATMSHELRTPLNGILGMNELLLTTPLSDRQRQYVEASSSSGKLLVQLINDILDLSKIEAGKLELDERECDIEALVFDIAEIMALNAKQKGLTLACHISPEASVVAVCDDNRLRQVLVNLIGNALKFTTHGGITIAVDRIAQPDGSSKFRFSVTDTGIGIPASRMHRLFEPFSQLDSSTTRRFGGTGLGLAICRKLIDLMGGEFGVESQVGSGSTFWFVIPMAVSQQDAGSLRRRELLRGMRMIAVKGIEEERQHIEECLTHWGCAVARVATLKEALRNATCAEAAGLPVAIVLADSRVVIGDEYVVLQKLAKVPNIHVILVGAPPDDLSLDHLYSLGVRHVLRDPVRPSTLLNAMASTMSVAGDGAVHLPTHREHSVARQPIVTFTGHVLVAEDNRINQLYVVEMLKHFGCTCDLVGNGEEALAAVKRQHYDLILMDCQMPEMDGFAASREIRRWESAADPQQRMPIVALTANALKGDQERCLEAGMDEYVTKPVEANQLRAVLERFLAVAPAAVAESALAE